MTPAARLTLTGSGFCISAGTVAIILGLGYEHPVRADDTPSPPSKLAAAIGAAAPQLLDPDAPAPEVPVFTLPAPPPLAAPLPPAPVDMPPEQMRVRVAKTSADVGYIRVSTQPWGWATAGGQRIETIGSGRLVLTPGRHTVTIHCAECTPHRTATRSVVIKPNMTEHLVISWDEERARERAAMLPR